MCLILHCTALHCISLHYTTLRYTTLHYTTLHYTTLHYTTLHYTTLHYTTLHYTVQPTATMPAGEKINQVGDYKLINVAAQRTKMNNCRRNLVTGRSVIDHKIVLAVGVFAVVVKLFNWKSSR